MRKLLSWLANAFVNLATGIAILACVYYLFVYFMFVYPVQFFWAIIFGLVAVAYEVASRMRKL